MTARLTIDQVRVGMKVMCVDPDYNRGLHGGTIYEVAPRKNCDPLDEVGVVGIRGTFLINRFIAAPALPAMTPELLAAHTGWYWSMAKWMNAGVTPTPEEAALMTAIERAGILDEPAPRVTDVQAQIREGWRA